MPTAIMGILKPVHPSHLPKMNEISSSNGFLWTAIINGVGLEGCEDIPNDSGAYIRVFTWVSNREEFATRTKEAMEYYKIHIVAMTDIEPVQDGKLYGEEPEMLSDFLAQTANTKGFIFGTVHLYPLKDGHSA